MRRCSRFELKIAKKVSNLWGSVHGALGAAYHMAGNLSKAIVCWETLLHPALQSTVGFSLVGFSVHLSLGISYLQDGRVDHALREFKIADSLKTDESTMPRRFPKVAIEIGKASLSSWVKDGNAQSLLNLMIPMAWGLVRPDAC